MQGVARRRLLGAPPAGGWALGALRKDFLVIFKIHIVLISVCLVTGVKESNCGEAKLGDSKSVVNGVTLHVSLDKSQFKFAAQDPIAVHLKIDNGRPDSITLWSCGFWPNHRVEITDENGEEPPLTEFGRNVRKAFASGARDKNVPFVVQPGKSGSYTSGDLRKMYEMKPGKYKVQVLFNEVTPPSPIRIVSQPISFELK